jgi:hypothetical protein
MESACAAHRRPSPKDLPVWWHRDRDDFSYFIPLFGSIIAGGYMRDDSHSPLTMFQRRT